MSEILHIEGQRVDLTPNTINRTLQINNIGEAKDRQSNYSNTNKLPMTPNNVKVFKFLGVSGNTSTAPYRKLRCDYSKNGIPLIRNGYAVVKATNTHYEVVIYDGIIDLAERIKGRKLNQLDFSDLNHYLTQVEYESSLDNTEGYIYAIGEFIPHPYFGTIKIQEQAPSLFVKTVWDKIWKGAGLRYAGSFFSENADFQTEVIAPSKGYTVENIELNSQLLGSGETNIISRNASSNDPLLRFEDQHFFTSGNYNGVIMNLGFLEFTSDAQIRLNIDTTYNNYDSYVTLQVRLNGGTRSAIQLPPGGTSKQTTINLNLSAGDELSFFITGSYAITQQEPDSGGQSTIDDRYWISYSASSIISITELTGGQFIDFATFTSNMDQLSFVKDVMQRYGLLLKPVRNTDTYEFIQFESMLNNKADAEDWTKKLDRILGEKYNIQYARVNDAKYNYPDEIVDHLYDGVLTIDNENADPEKNLFTSPFQIATKRPREFKNKSIYQVPIWEEKEEDGTMIITNKETPVKIFRISRVDTSITTTFFDNTNSITVTGLIPFLSLENMQMQYFLNVYYKAFKILINRTKQVDARFKLNEIDIYNLDFFKLKYLKQTGKFYYLNHVKHSPDKLNKAELIQLNGFSVNLPPTVLGVYDTTISYKNSRSISIQNITDQTNPAYFDPEFDQPAAIMITGGFNPDILIKNADQVITSQTEILADNWNLTIQDAGNTTNEHSAAFTFKIKDAGSGQYSEVEGTIKVTVREYINTPPVANAGEDSVVQIPTDEYSSIGALDGSGSTDNTGEIVSYSWIITSKPIDSTATINNPNQMNSALMIPNNDTSIGTYTIELTVTDEFGVSDSDTVNISVQPADIHPE